MRQSCDVGEYSDYENCKCRSNLVDKLVEECTENVDQVKIAGILLIALFERRSECKSSCTTCVILIAIVFTFRIGIGTYFLYCRYMNHDKNLLLNTIMSIKHKIININGKRQRNKH